MFSILATVTGSIWAKFNWGSFWNWGPAETSIFILLLIYGSLFALRSAIDNEDKTRTAIGGIFNYCLFNRSVFYFHHAENYDGIAPGSLEIDPVTNKVVQGTSPVVDFKMNGSMRVGIFYITLAFTILYYWLWNLRAKAIIIKENLSKKLN